MGRRLMIVLLTVQAVLVATPGAAAAAPAHTVVIHDQQETVFFDDDICGPRANTTTFTRKLEQSRVALRDDGTFQYREVAVVTWTSDYVDPAIEDKSGRLTEVLHFAFTPGKVFVATVTFHDFSADFKIVFSSHITEVDGEIRVDHFVDRTSGCP